MLIQSYIPESAVHIITSNFVFRFPKSKADSFFSRRLNINLLKLSFSRSHVMVRHIHCISVFVCVVNAVIVMQDSRV